MNNRTQLFALLIVICLLASCGGGGGTDPNDVASRTQNFTASTNDVTEDVVQGLLDDIGISLATTGTLDSSGASISKMADGNESHDTWSGHPTLKGIFNTPLHVPKALNDLINFYAFSAGLVRTENINSIRNSAYNLMLKNLVSLETIDQSAEVCPDGGSFTIDINDSFLSGQSTDGNAELTFDNCQSTDDDSNVITQDGSISFTFDSNGISVDSNGDAVFADTVSASLNISFADYNIESPDGDSTFNGDVTFNSENTVDSDNNTFESSGGTRFSNFTGDFDEAPAPRLDPNLSITPPEGTTLNNTSLRFLARGNTEVDEDGNEVPTCDGDSRLIFVAAMKAGDAFKGSTPSDEDRELYARVAPTDDSCTSSDIRWAAPFGKDDIYVMVLGEDRTVVDVTVRGPDAAETDDDVDVNVDATDCDYTAQGNDLDFEDTFNDCNDDYEVEWGITS